MRHDLIELDEANVTVARLLSIGRVEHQQPRRGNVDAGARVEVTPIAVAVDGGAAARERSTLDIAEVALVVGLGNHLIQMNLVDNVVIAVALDLEEINVARSTFGDHRRILAPVSDRLRAVIRVRACDGVGGVEPKLGTVGLAEDGKILPAVKPTAAMPVVLESPIRLSL